MRGDVIRQESLFSYVSPEARMPFTKNRDWLLEGEIARKFFAAVLEQLVVGTLSVPTRNERR